MAESCILIPTVKVGDTEVADKVFTDLMSITKDRDTAKRIYVMTTEKEIMDRLGIDKRPESGTEAIDALGSASDILEKDAYERYVNTKENLSHMYDRYSKAHEVADRLGEKYSDMLFLVSGREKAHTVSGILKTGETARIYAEQERKNALMNNLRNLVNSLGFDISVKDMEDNGRFSPETADRNADGLKQIITIAKGERGLNALPEEFFHLVVEGMQNNPLMQRFMSRLTDEAVEEILGESYDTYYDRYNGDEERLRREAAAKVLAQTLVDRENIGDISFVSRKVTNAALGNFAKASVSDVDAAISDAFAVASSIVDKLNDRDFFSAFDGVAVGRSKTMYSAAKSVSAIEDVVDKAYFMMNKKFKIMSARSSIGEMTADQKKTLAKMKEDIEKKKYASSCLGFLSMASTDIADLNDRIESFQEEHDVDDLQRRDMVRIFKLLRKARTTIDAYSDIVTQMSILGSTKDIEDDLDSDDIQKIEKGASIALHSINSLLDTYKNLRLNLLLKLYESVWGSEYIIRNVNGKPDVSVLDVLSIANKDISGFGRWVNSISELDSPLLGLVDRLVSQNSSVRDAEINTMKNRINAVHKRYRDATGSNDTSFMYELDENGVPTGTIRCEIDYAKYKAARQAKLEEFANTEGKSDAWKKAKMQQWERQNCEWVVKDPMNPKKKELMPRKYNQKGEPMYYKPLVFENKAQEEYYTDIMKIKGQLDDLLPPRYTHRYLAVQKVKDMKDIVLQGGSPVKSIKQALKRLKDSFVRNISDTEYGQVVDENGNIITTEQVNQVLLDFSGNPLDKVPVFYTSELADKSMLSTEFTDSLVAYSAMAYNYRYMSDIVDALELTKDLVGDMDIKQKSSGAKMMERFRSNGETFERDLTKNGINSQMYKKLENYIKTLIYSKSKEEENVAIGSHSYNAGKMADVLKWYTSVLGLGFNIFSGSSNLAMGIVQTMMQGIGGEFFNLKNVALANKWYFGNLGGCLADQYREDKQNKLTLLIDKFDSLEEFYNESSQNDANKGLLKKVIGKINPMVFNSMGEHYLHAISMLAMLDSRKVLVNGKETSLMNAFSVVEEKTPEGLTVHKLKLAEGTTDLDGTEITEDNIFQLREEIQNVNHRMHGAFNMADRGDANRNAIGRLLFNFRQWMPGFYTDRFGGSRMNISTKQENEGFYITAWNYLRGTLSDARHLKFNLASRFKQLTSHQKANMRKAMTEASFFYLLSLLLGVAGKPDRDHDWLASALNTFKLTGYRLKTEIGAAFPLNWGFPQNIETLVRTPLPAMENSGKLMSLLKFSDMFVEIQSGKYQGWSQYEKNLYHAVPFARNIGRVFELAQGDVSAFNAYKGKQFK